MFTQVMLISSLWKSRRVFGNAVLAMRANNALPEHHFSTASKDVVGVLCVCERLVAEALIYGELLN